MGHLREISGKVRHLKGCRPRGIPDDFTPILRLSRFNTWLIPDVVEVDLSGDRIEDQGDLGSCVLNAHTSVMEHKLRRAWGRDVQLSRLYAYNGVREMEGTPLNQDTGVNIYDSVRWMEEVGTPEEHLFPYDLSKSILHPPDNLREEAGKYRVSLHTQCPSIDTIRASLWQGFPPIMGFALFETVDSDWCRVTGQMPFNPRLPIVGYHCMYFHRICKSAGKAWLRNSWSQRWGDNGDMIIDLAQIQEGYAFDAYAVRGMSVR